VVGVVRRRSGRRARSGFGLLLPSARTRRALRSAARSVPPPLLPPAAKKAAPKKSAPKKATARRSPAGRWIRSSFSAPVGHRAYDVYLPAGHRRGTAVPLVVLLHGCRQSAAEFVDATRFTALADRHGFVLACPQQSLADHGGGCWRWYEAGHQGRGAGEPAVLAGITARVLAERDRWRIDPSRVYAAGISAGGAMALTLGVAYPDVFAAVGVHSAPAYRSAGHGGHALGAMQGRRAIPVPEAGARMAPAIIFQGTADPVVSERSGDQVADQWLAHDAALDQGRPQRIRRSRATVGRTADGRRHTITRWYDARGRKRLEYWRVDGLGHAWSGGRKGGSYSDPRGPRASTTMWRFFAAHRL
jgi:poly(hydroxyalkanoate) depolymerase family esterase